MKFKIFLTSLTIFLGGFIVVLAMSGSQEPDINFGASQSGLPQWHATSTDALGNTIPNSITQTQGKNVFIDGVATTTGSLSVSGVSYIWPTSQGASLTVLQNDGAGNLSWSVSAGGGGGGGGIGWTWNNVSLIYNATSSDDVLLGATSTTTPSKLEVVGDVNFIGNATTTGGLIVGTTQPPTTPIPIGDLFIGGNATSSTLAATQFCISNDCKIAWTTWDTLTNKPATSTVLSLLDSDGRIATLNATTTNTDTLVVYTGLTVPASSIPWTALTGIPTSTTDQLTEGVTNLYYTQARWDTAFIATTTWTGFDSLFASSFNATSTFGGNSQSASALAANGTNCSAGSFPLGVDASGNAENCTVDGAGGGGTNDWQFAFDNAITPTTTATGIFVTASSTIIGNFRVDGNATTTGNLSIGNVSYVWPSSQGGASQVLQNDGAGNLTWATVSGGGSGGTDGPNYLVWDGVASLRTATTSDDFLIGATATTTQAKLEVSGNVNIIGSATTTGGLVIGTVPPITPIPTGDLFNSGNATTSGYLIVGTANASIRQQAGNLYVGGNATTTGNLSIGNVSYIWPNSQGAATTFLQNDGSGNLTWTAQAAGNWDTLTNKPATSTVLSLLDSDSRITVLNATTTNVDTLNVYSSITGAGYTWDTLNNRPATSTILSLLDSDGRIAVLNATTTNIDTLNVFTESRNVLLHATTTDFDLLQVTGNGTTTGNFAIGTGASTVQGPGDLFVTGNATTTALNTTRLTVGTDDLSDLTGTGLVNTAGALTVSLTGGTGITFSGSTISLDTTEVEATTWGAGGNASNVWTYNLSGTDPTLTVKSGGFLFGGTLEVEGNASTTGSLVVGTAAGGVTINTGDTFISGAATSTSNFWVGNASNGGFFDIIANGWKFFGTAKPQRTIVLTAGGATPTIADDGTATTTQSTVLFTTNREVVNTLDFDDSTDNSAQWLTLLPDNYDAGTLTATIYSTATSTTGNVSWCIRGTAYADQGALDTASLGTYACWGNQTVATANTMVVSTSTTITIGNTPVAGSSVLFEVRRDTADDDRLDKGRLLQVKLKYSTNALSD
jgi:hypothetical protein